MYHISIYHVLLSRNQFFFSFSVLLFLFSFLEDKIIRFHIVFRCYTEVNMKKKNHHFCSDNNSVSMIYEWIVFYDP